MLNKYSNSGWAFLRLLRKKPPSPALLKICHTYPTVIKSGTDIPYLEKLQKIYESRDTTLEFW